MVAHLLIERIALAGDDLQGGAGHGAVLSVGHRRATFSAAVNPERIGVLWENRSCIEGFVFGARPRGVPPPPGPFMWLASANVAPSPPKSRRLFRDVPPRHTQWPVGMILISRLWSQIQRRFYGHDDLSVRDETL